MNAPRGLVDGITGDAVDVVFVVLKHDVDLDGDHPINLGNLAVLGPRPILCIGVPGAMSFHISHPRDTPLIGLVNVPWNVTERRKFLEIPFQCMLNDAPDLCLYDVEESLDLERVNR